MEVWSGMTQGYTALSFAKSKCIVNIAGAWNQAKCQYFACTTAGNLFTLLLLCWLVILMTSCMLINCMLECDVDKLQPAAIKMINGQDVDKYLHCRMIYPHRCRQHSRHCRLALSRLHPRFA